MGIYNTLLNIVPIHCRYCVQGSYGVLHISEEAKKWNMRLIELQGSQAEKMPVWETLAQEDPIFVCGFGHGNNCIYTGDTETAIFTCQECNILKGRVVYLLSCLTANGLGPKMIEEGAIAYAGYKVSWTWMSNDMNADPYLDWYAEAFYRSANELPIALIRGEAVAQARESCIAEYNRWLNIWETDRVHDGSSASVIKWLIVDRDGLVTLGDLSATVMYMGVRTVLDIEKTPPNYVHSGEIFSCQGMLKDRETGLPLANKIISLMQGKNEVVTTNTDDLGKWSFQASFQKGIQVIYITFKGDDVYAPIFSVPYNVEVGTTKLEVLFLPPSSADPGQVFSFTGVLKEKGTGKGLSAKIVNLMQSGVNDPIRSVVTDNDGVWNFQVSFTEISRYRLRVVFNGDENYVESTTLEYSIAVGTMPIFGYDKVGPVLPTSENVIIGSSFTAPESGIAKFIVPYQQYWGTGRCKCAIYRKSDLTLLGVTEEIQWTNILVNRREWVPYRLLEPISVEVGIDYILVQWSESNGSAYLDNQYVGERYMQKMLEYGDFPLMFERASDYVNGRVSVYCEYTPLARKLSVNSSPISNVPVFVDNILAGTTPIVINLHEGQHTVGVPDNI